MIGGPARAAAHRAAHVRAHRRPARDRPVHGRGRADARARGRRAPQRARQGHRQPAARRRDAARRHPSRWSPGARPSSSSRRPPSPGIPGALRRRRALQPRGRRGAPARPDARRLPARRALQHLRRSSADRTRVAMSVRTTLRGAEPEVAFDAWLAALAESGLARAAARPSSVALDERRRPRAGRAADRAGRQPAAPLRGDGRLRDRRRRRRAAASLPPGVVRRGSTPASRSPTASTPSRRSRSRPRAPPA